MNSQVIESCTCSVVSLDIKKIYDKPHLYISFLQNYISNYRFHYMYEHYEQYVSNHFLTKFVCSITDILNSFRKQVLFYDQIVEKPINNIVTLSEAIQICGKIIEKYNATNIGKIEKQIVIELLNFMQEIFKKWEVYVFENGITSFV